MKKNIKIELNKNRLIELLNAVRKISILVFGDLMLDEFIWGKVNRISPEAPVPVVNVTKQSYALGGAANVVNNLRALGCGVYVFGIIGDDDIGNRILDEFQNIGAKPLGVVRDKSRPTTLKTRVVAHHQQVVRIDREIITPISPSIKKELLKKIDKAVVHCHALIIQDYGKGIITSETLAYVRKIAQRYKIPISVDPKLNHFSYYKGVDVITPNHYEAGAFVGIEIKNETNLIQTGRKILKLLSGGSVLITRGEEGMSLFEPSGEITHIPTKAREVFDVSGAGDTVIATMTAILSAGGSLKEAAIIANYAAGVVVGKVGIATCSPDELINAYGASGNK